MTTFYLNRCHTYSGIRDSTRVLEGRETPAIAAARGFPGFPSYWQTLSSLFSFIFPLFVFHFSLFHELSGR